MSATTKTRAVADPNEDQSNLQTVGHLKALNFVKELARHDPSMPLGAILVLIYLYGYRDRLGGVSLRKLRQDLGMTSTIATRSI